MLRRRLEGERDGEGTREYIRVLRLLEKHPLKKLTQAVEKALRVGVRTAERADLIALLRSAIRAPPPNDSDKRRRGLGRPDLRTT